MDIVDKYLELKNLVLHNTRAVCLQPSILKNRYIPSYDREVFTNVMINNNDFIIYLFIREGKDWLKEIYYIDHNYKVSELDAKYKGKFYNIIYEKE